jgi:hypothetical protein
MEKLLLTAVAAFMFMSSATSAHAQPISNWWYLVDAAHYDCEQVSDMAADTGEKIATLGDLRWALELDGSKVRSVSRIGDVPYVRSGRPQTRSGQRQAIVADDKPAL